MTNLDFVTELAEMLEYDSEVKIKIHRNLAMDGWDLIFTVCHRIPLDKVGAVAEAFEQIKLEIKE